MNKADPTQELVRHLSASLADGTFVRLILSRPTQPENNPEKIVARCVDLRETPHLSFTFRFPTKDITKNMTPAAGISWLKEQIGREFRSAWLSTTKRDWQLSWTKSGESRLVPHKPSVMEPPSREHDQARHEILDASAQDWLRALGVVDDTGKVRERMADKHRQINRYLEILTHLAKDCGWRPSASSERESARASKRQGVETSAGYQEENPLTLPTLERSTLQRPSPGAELTMADMGCGKGYLTFGVWHLFQRVWGIPVRVIGVEEREDLASSTSKVARDIRATGLQFIPGTIAAAALPRVDALIALHACNTATDHAILRGIEHGAKLILTAPCCHKELRPQMNHPSPLAPVLKHGVMEERMAEWVTDGLRALFLEWAGYQTKIFEFISTEHTAKNLMISAVRDRAPFSSATARKRIEELKAYFGIKQHALDGLLAGSPDGAAAPQPR